VSLTGLAYDRREACETVPVEGYRVRTVPFAVPDIEEDDVAAVAAALRSGWITTGPRVREFEESVRAAVGAPAALGLSSCTAAMHVGLKALGIGDGDEVVTSTMTFCSTVHVIEQSGAVPVLVDVRPDTLNIDPDQVADVLRRNPRVRAVMPVHYAGHPADMDAIHELTAERGIGVVEDAAHALGAAYRGSPVGAVREGRDDHAVAFSFYATKNLTTAEGGMLTGSERLVREASTWSLHGMSRDAWQRYDVRGSWAYDVTVAGFKYNLTDLQAAFGLSQLRRFDAMQARRRGIVEAYRAGLAEVAAVELPAEAADVTHAWHLFPIRLRLELLSVDRATFIERLAARGVAASVHFIPVHQHSYYRKRFDPAGFPVADAAFERLVSLPLHTKLTEDDVAYVVDVVTATAADCAR
jgi:dTDP-4-amino-4,6-dideoxygalactose transaminase